MKHVRTWWIALVLVIGTPLGLHAEIDLSADQSQLLLAQGSQSGQPPTYTKEQIEQLKKQNERAQNQNALIKQAMEAMNAKNWQAAVAPLQQLIADDPNNWQFHSAMGDVQFNLGS
jgi:predicted Zn-dependent protease